jgi:hypothetical protein
MPMGYILANMLDENLAGVEKINAPVSIGS